MYRRMKNLNPELFANKVNKKGEDSEDLESFVSSLEGALRETLDELTPEITKQVTIRKKTTHGSLKKSKLRSMY